MTKYQFTITDHHQLRFDRALSLLIPGISRSSIVKAIKSGKASINGFIIVDANMPVKKNDLVHVTITVKKGSVNHHLTPIAMELDILFEDEHLIILNKPAGIIVHPGDNEGDEITLVHGLIAHTKNLSTIGGHSRPGIVHRLDKDTSGLMVVAKTDIAHLNIAKQLKDRTLSRKYQAFIWHSLSPLNGTINLAIGRNPVDRTKRAVQKNGGKLAITHYKTEKILQKNLLSQIECTLETGRTHQIRVHLSYMGCSVFGDQTYGHHHRKLKKMSTVMQDKLKNFQRQALHSWQISLIHPMSQEKLKFEVALPSDMHHLKTLLES